MSALAVLFGCIALFLSGGFFGIQQARNVPMTRQQAGCMGLGLLVAGAALVVLGAWGGCRCGVMPRSRAG